MKCQFCGANYEDELLKCPYCGADNPKGQEIADLRKKRKGFVESLRLDTLRKNKKLLISVVMTGIIVICLLILVIFCIILGVSDSIQVKMEERRTSARSTAEHRTELDKLREQGDYQGVCEYLMEWNLSGETNEEDWQFYEIGGDLLDFKIDMERIRNSQKEQLEDGNYFIWVAFSVHDILRPEDGFDAVYDCNREYYEECLEEIEVMMLSQYDMTKEEYEGWIRTIEEDYKQNEAFGAFLQERMVYDEE